MLHLIWTGKTFLNFLDFEDFSWGFRSFVVLISEINCAAGNLFVTAS